MAPHARKPSQANAPPFRSFSMQAMARTPFSLGLLYMSRMDQTFFQLFMLLKTALVMRVDLLGQPP